MAEYSAESIQSLDYFNHIRQYPGNYVGSKDAKGLHHLVKEILSNSIDDYLNGACTEILVKLLKDGGCYVRDNGRGIPHGTHSSGCSILQACFGVQLTGGKFNNATGQSGYNTSGGEHGIGTKAVNALSSKMIVSTARDGKTETVEFSKGKFINYTSGDIEDEHGVTVLFYPDPEVLETVDFDASVVEQMVHEFSYLCKGLTFHFVDERAGIDKTFLSKNGLGDYIEYLSKGKPMIIKPIYFTQEEGSYQVEAAVTYTSAYTSTVKLYTNNIPQERGTHLTGFKIAFTTTFNQYLRNKGILKEKDENLTGADLEEGQILVLNFKMIDPVFMGQNKEELSSSEGRTYVQKLATMALRAWLEVNEKDAKIIAEKAISARKARNAAKKAREAVREAAPKEKKTPLKFTSRLADAWSKDRKKCEIYIVEGLSAAGNMKEARNNEYQAVLSVRGKIINVLKQPLDKLMANAELRDMINAFGLTLDVKNGKVTVDESKLRYGKIIISADADIDGAHICILFYTFIWTFAPELIEKGYIYATIPPLYKVTMDKKYIYVRDDAALEEFRNKNRGKKYVVNRLKGLGEMDSDELGLCLLDHETRLLKQITVNDAERATKLFEDLMGTAVQPRKDYIEAHGAEAEVDF